MMVPNCWQVHDSCSVSLLFIAVIHPCSIFIIHNFLVHIQISEELIKRLEYYGQIGCDEETLKVTMPSVHSPLYLWLLYRIT